MSEEGKDTRARRRRGAPTPWVKKRRRLVILISVFTLVLLPAFVWRAGLAREVRTQLAALREAGRPTSLDQLHEAMVPLPPEANTATFFRQASVAFRDVPLEHWDNLPFRGKVVLPVGEAIPETNRVAMEALVVANASALGLLHEGAQRSQCRYIERYESGFGFSERPHVGATQLMTTLLCSDAVLLGDAGNPSDALTSLTTATALVASLSADGLYPSLSYRWQLEAHILAALRRLMGQADYTEEQLRPFRAQIDPERRIAQWRRMCDVEQCLFLSRIGEGRNRSMARNVLLAMGIGDLNLRAYLALMTEARDGFGVPWMAQQKIIARHAAWETRIDERPMLYVTLTVNFGQPPAYWALMRARWDEALVAKTALDVAIHKGDTGSYPKDLGTPTPILSDGSPLHYEQRDGGFRLWRKFEGQASVDCWVVVPTPTIP